MSSLLKELQRLKPRLPETECFVPEWNRHVTLRGFSVAEGKAMRKAVGPTTDDPDANAEQTIRLIAHSLVDGNDRPLGNEEGIALIESLSELTVRNLATAFIKISTGDQEKNEEPSPRRNGSSTASPSDSDEPSKSSSAISASVN